jgi:hypothetical protein
LNDEIEKTNSQNDPKKKHLKEQGLNFKKIK